MPFAMIQANQIISTLARGQTTLYSATELSSRPERTRISCHTALDTNRHRGSGHPLSPATPPDMRVRIRRFGRIELRTSEQPGKSKCVEVGDGQCVAQRGAVDCVPRAVNTPGRLSRHIAGSLLAYTVRRTVPYRVSIVSRSLNVAYAVSIDPVASNTEGVSQKPK